MLAIPKADNLDVVQSQGAAGWWDVASRSRQYAMVRAGKRALLDRYVIEDFNVVYLDLRVGKSGEPASEELCASGLSQSARTGRLEKNVIRQHCSKPLDIVRVESVCPSLENLACCHRAPPS
jgi:hypothetical protein